jgi:hypothetical protein
VSIETQETHKESMRNLDEPIFFFLFGVFQRVRRNSAAPLELSYAEPAKVTARLAERMIFSMSTPFRDDDAIGMSGYEGACATPAISCV